MIQYLPLLPKAVYRSSVHLKKHIEWSLFHGDSFLSSDWLRLQTARA